MLLYVFVEGDDDERFFESGKVAEKLQKKYEIKIITYAGMKKERREDYINSIESMKKQGLVDGYIFITDIDDSPCIKAKKKKVHDEKAENIDYEKIVVVKKEIESWYYAGLSKEICKKLKMKFVEKTEDLTKEKFDDLIPKGNARSDIMVEILKYFSIEIAKERNGSFKYFIDKYDC